MKKIFLFAVIITAAFASCNFVGGKRVRGNGDIKTETRSEHGFQTIEVRGAINVFVTQDSAFSVKVEADANLLQHIETYMDKNTLIVRPENGYNLKPSRSVKVYVTGPRFRYFEVSGASSIRSENKLTSEDEIFVDVSGAGEVILEVKSPMVGVKSSGASKTTMTGETKELKIECSGASHAKCFDLLSENAEVELSGASGAQVFASVKLKANASGASHIKYKGNAEVIKETSGAASVEKVE